MVRESREGSRREGEASKGKWREKCLYGKERDLGAAEVGFFFGGPQGIKRRRKKRGREKKRSGDGRKTRQNLNFCRARPRPLPLKATGDNSARNKK